MMTFGFIPHAFVPHLRSPKELFARFVKESSLRKPELLADIDR